MFFIHTVHDTIKIPPSSLSMSTVQAIHNEIDHRYPNRVLMDVGLVVARYGDCLRVGHGVCVPGLGGSHHPCTFRLIIFRPFVDEICLGRIRRSNAEGIQVSLGFFENISVPAYWMLRPSRYEESTGLWIWTPNYEENQTEEGLKELTNGTLSTNQVDSTISQNETSDNHSRYEMEIGAEIRFRVKSIHFAQITNTAKGMQALMTTTDKAASSQNVDQTTRTPSEATQPSSPIQQSQPDHDTSRLGDTRPPHPVRRRSSSVGLDSRQAVPPAMSIVASICEDGLGLTSWWTGDDDEDEEDYEGEKEADITTGLPRADSSSKPRANPKLEQNGV